jgi:hypothetical protein
VISWSGDRLEFTNIRVNMSNIRDMIHRLVQSTKDQLFRDLMLMEFDPDNDEVILIKLPEIPWGSLVDDGSNIEVGYSFMTDARNVIIIDREARQLEEYGSSWI